MKVNDKIFALKSKISAALTPIVDRPYRLLEIPDYRNIGDILIFEGELAFLRTVRHRCLEMATMRSFAYRLPKISKDELLIFRGGGYFGDMWPSGWAFQRKVLENYPDNPMIMFPQSTCFVSEKSLRDAVKRYGAHKNLTLCLRDKASYELVKNNFPNKSLLVPDMAFFADIDRFRSANRDCKSTLLMKRTDKEYKHNCRIDELLSAGDVDVADWGSVNECGNQIEGMMQRLRCRPRRCSRIYDLFTRYVYRPYQLKLGVRLLDQYKHIYSTRLHGCLMALMLGKKVSILDNSYGKISSLYNTWLSDCDNIELIG